VPELRGPGQEQRRGHGLCERADDVRPDDDDVPRQAVCPDPAHEQEDDLRHRSGGRREANVADRAGQVEDGEGQRDDRERRPSVRDHPTEEHEPELALRERSQRAAHSLVPEVSAPGDDR
jgi:hypothetical protein